MKNTKQLFNEDDAMENTPLISVIVPVYKVEKYLNRCVESIREQTYTHLELLLVDDGSLDSSGEICDEYALEDERIVVIHKPNGGVSSARNVGIRFSSGVFMNFIDSDDWVGEEYLTHLFAPFQCNPSLTLSVSGIIFNYSGGEETKALLPCINDTRTEIRALVNPFVWISGPYCKLYKSEIIKGKRCSFDASVFIAEDTLFVVDYVNRAKGLTEHILSNDYHYFKVDESATNSPFSSKRLSHMIALDKMRSIIEDKKATDYIQVTKVSHMVAYHSWILGQPQWKKEQIYLRREIRKEMKTGIRNPEMPLKIKAVALLTTCNAYWLYRLYSKTKMKVLSILGNR